MRNRLSQVKPKDTEQVTGCDQDRDSGLPDPKVSILWMGHLAYPENRAGPSYDLLVLLSPPESVYPDTSCPV